jgi:hypothetical protein
MREKLQPSLKPSRTDRIVGNITYEVLAAAVPYKIVDPNGYLNQVMDVLYPWPKNLKAPGGVLIGLNHTSMKDAMVGVKIIKEKLVSLKRGMGIATIKYFDETRKDSHVGKVFTWVTSKLNAATGLEVIRIVRPGEESEYYAMSEHSAVIGGKTPEAYNQTAYSGIIKKTRREGKATVFAPEAHRSWDGKLSRANDVDGLLKLSGDESVFLPLGLVPVPHKEGIINKAKRLLAKIEVRVGKPMTYAQLEAKTKAANEQLAPLLPRVNYNKKHPLTPLTVSDTMMLEIAKLLPEEYWGDYTEYMQLLRMSNNS